VTASWSIACPSEPLKLKLGIVCNQKAAPPKITEEEAKAVFIAISMFGRPIPRTVPRHHDDMISGVKRIAFLKVSGLEIEDNVVSLIRQ
jgi:hypothetical protein